jgi:hypothetical protein
MMVLRFVPLGRACVIALLVVLASGQVVQAGHPIHRQGTGRMTYMYDLDEGRAGGQNLYGPEFIYEYSCLGEAATAPWQATRPDGPCDGRWPRLFPEYGMRIMDSSTAPSYATCRDAAKSTAEVVFADLADGTWLCVKARHPISGSHWGTRMARVKVVHSPRHTEAFVFKYLVWE